MHMRTLCPNLDRDDALETVLEVPVPEEIFASSKIKSSWPNIMSWMKSSPEKPPPVSSLFGGRDTEIQLLLGVVGAPLIPLPVIHSRHYSFTKSFKDHPIENSMAKYIVQQYIAAAGGESALNSIHNMYAMGKVKMATTEVVSGEALSLSSNNSHSNRGMKVKSLTKGPGEMGGFVLWQKRPDLWNLELVVSGYKISAGSDGKVAWRQTPWHHSHASRGPPRPLRRSLQGLDPRSTANLFSNSICTGEKTVNDEDCFVLKLEVEPSVLRARSSSRVEIIRHTLWGYFSQRTGLLVFLEDTHLLRIKAPGNEVFWETTMESQIEDYLTVDGVNVAHSGRTCVSLFRFGEDSDSHTRTRMEEVWTIEEVDFNIKGLSMDCFLPPADLRREDERSRIVSNDSFSRNAKSPFKVRPNASSRLSATTKGFARVVAIDDYDRDVNEDQEYL